MAICGPVCVRFWGKGSIMLFFVKSVIVLNHFLLAAYHRSLCIYVFFRCSILLHMFGEKKHLLWYEMILELLDKERAQYNCNNFYSLTGTLFCLTRPFFNCINPKQIIWSIFVILAEEWQHECKWVLAI